MIILLSSNKKVIEEYVEEKSKIGFIPTASEPDDDSSYMEKDRQYLKSMNFDIINIDITNESYDEIIEKLSRVDVVFVAGGNCFYLLQKLKEKDVLKNLIEFANNKIYIGSSAGACIVCPSIHCYEKLDDKTQAPLLNDYDGMNLIDCFILPHYQSKDKYTKLGDEIIKEYSHLKFLPIQNNQAVIVNNKTDYKVVMTE